MSGKEIIIEKDNGGWGGPLRIPVDTNKKVLSMTGGGIHHIAKHIADLAGVQAVDGFKSGLCDDEILLAVINCGGTLRCGVYPKKGVFTVNLNAIGPSGPLAEFINEDIYVSGVTPESIHVSSKESTIIEGTQKSNKNSNSNKKVDTTMNSNVEDKKENWFISAVEKMGTSLGKVISLAYEAGKESVNTVIKSVLPFMVFVSVLVTIILSSGIGNAIANALKPMASSLVGLIVISIICGFPFLSPLLGPGAAIAQVIGVLLGSQIAVGAIPPQYALPALFAINVQVGADFVPVGLSMQEAEPDTIKYGTPAFLLSRQITGPIAVIIAYLMSIGMY
ncbi:PTS glucitol/sorbitol transporter subunit IIB [Clostridium sp. Cult2]|uniref:PTS glucitol/sorbitol transporter subunit IIB n=1 Tax=Clostridium sp. Cult2 TaxID=2079003 RepID=UPI001F268840|nr:PTS glucitol/sorbitol transporter subunit IIB [Clostridium sp. Cult2]MCF6466204.1 PTS sorbitol transporter subunit IIB [Clostridium sp. Cult2]